MALSEWLGYMNSSRVSISVGQVTIDTELIGFIWEQVEEGMASSKEKSPSVKPNPKGYGPGHSYGQVLISETAGDYIEKDWDEGEWEDLVTLGFLEIAGEVMPKGTYPILIGKFLRGYCELAEDKLIFSREDEIHDLKLKGTYLISPAVAGTAVKIKAKLSQPEDGFSNFPMLICTGFADSPNGNFSEGLQYQAVSNPLVIDLELPSES